MSAAEFSVIREELRLLRGMLEQQAGAGRGRESRHVHIGAGANLDPAVSLLASSADRVIRIGDRVTIYRGVEILGPVTIGDATFINRDVYIRPNVTIGANVSIGPFSRLITDSHQIGPASRRAGALSWDPITIGAGAWIGAGVTVLPGVTVGEGAVLAAGAVVTADVAPHALVGGVPARFIKSLP
jgi:acetyltransferase-like isoleucine patch superfamily enzyme